MARLDGTRINALREARNWTWDTLSERSGVTVSRLHQLRSNEAVEVRDDTVFRLAAAFQVEPEGLFRTPYTSVRWMIPVALHDRSDILPDVELMQHLDMAGQAQQAEVRCRALLEAVPEDLEVRAYLTVMLAVYLEHLQRSHDALDLLQVVEEELQGMHQAPHLDRRFQAALLWVRYQKGVCLIVEGQLIEARQIFTDLQTCRLFPELRTESQSHISSSLHQLGVISYLSGDVQDARTYFQRALDSRAELHCLTGHRPGFTLRRLGEVAEALGDYEAALDRYLDALEIFARYHCARYLALTRDAIRRVAGLLGPGST